MTTASGLVAVVVAGCIGAVAVSAGGDERQTSSGDALVALLRQGGRVMVMRHASSPGEAPTREVANADNVKLERQLDQAGRDGSMRMGRALRDLKIPIGEVLSSPTYRALETVRLAQLSNPQVHAELGDGGQSMQRMAEAHGAWLRDRAGRLPKGTNTIIVTHMPNITRAFPEWGAVAEGEVVMVGSDGKRRTRAVGRIRIEDWPGLR
jgi:phosphohistidine phosphatase SixA